MKRLFTFVWLIGLLNLGVYAQIQPEVAPLNPEYLKYLEMVEKGTFQISSDSFWFGAIPEPVLPNFDAYYQTKSETFKAFPARFDLREEGRVTPVKNQGACGSCWIFSTYGALESNLLTLGFGALDLSEDNVMHCGFNTNACGGGWPSHVVAYLATGIGPVKEADDPYTGTSEGDCLPDLSPAVYVTDARYLPADADLIKQTLMDMGGIGIFMSWGWDNYNPADYTYYGFDWDFNHCVTIVGWDDNKPTKGGKGAWIAKNSWGTYWGEQGYFYIAYQQTGVRDFYVFTDGMEREPGSEVYYYDLAGWSSSAGFGEEIAYGLTKFEASSDQSITKVGTFINASNSMIDIEIYDEFNDILLGSLHNLECTFPGYYTFDLFAPIDINQGNDFFIKVKYQTPQYWYPIPTDYYGPIESDKCWISPDGNSWWAMGEDTDLRRDLTIKAYTVPQAQPLEVESFTLVDADKHTDIAKFDPLADQAVINLKEVGYLLNIRANTSPKEVGSVVFELDGMKFRTENVSPYALAGDNPPGVYYPWTPTLGEHILKATPYTEKNGKGEKGTSLTLRFTVVEEDIPIVRSFTLVNADNDQDIRRISNGDVIRLGSLPSTQLNIRANTSPKEVGSVAFELDGKKFRTENVYPYALAGDNPPGDYHAWTPSLGSHTLTATPYSEQQGQGDQGKSLTITFEVQEDIAEAKIARKSSEEDKEKEVFIHAVDVEQGDSDLLVYPNPSTGIVTIEYIGEESEHVHIAVYDLTGRTIYTTERKTPFNDQIDLQKFGKGLKIVKVQSGNAVAVERIIIE